MNTSRQTSLRPMGERRFGRFNTLGLYTLMRREAMRFLTVWTQTLLAPVATAVLFLVVFSLAFAARGTAEERDAFVQFLAPGILMMAVIQNAFANSSSSLLVAKVQGNIVDTLMPPLSALELTLGYMVGGILRGLLIGCAIAAVVFPPVGLGLAHPLWALAFVLSGSALMAVFGILAAIYAEKFDHMAGITNFLVTPLTFLSGTFYSISVLPGWMQTLSHLNPFFYMIDGIRFGVLGQSDAPPALGLVFLLLCDVAAAWLAWRWFRSGYRLKS